MKVATAFAVIVAGASAFVVQPPAFRTSVAVNNVPLKGAGGMFDTRDPEPFQHEDPRKSIGAAPSFEEYLKSRGGGFAPGAPAQAAAPAPAPVAPAPAAAPAWGAPAPAAAPAWGAPAPAAPAASHAPAKGAGGMFDTRDPEPFQHEDPRKSIGSAPSFEEYLKSRGGGFAPGAPAPAAPAPAPVAVAPPPPAPAAAPAWGAAAPAAVAPPAASGGGFQFGEYDEKMWDNNSKKDVYNKWDPSQPRSSWNFNPFEAFQGNTPDASGVYPGEAFYKDPQRGDVNFQTMMDERAEADERNANPKPGSAPGCPGCKS